MIQKDYLEKEEMVANISMAVLIVFVILVTIFCMINSTPRSQFKPVHEWVVDQPLPYSMMVLKGFDANGKVVKSINLGYISLDSAITICERMNKDEVK